MDDLSRIGKSMNLESGSISLGCMMAGVSTKRIRLKCGQIDYQHYGKWYCPFSNW